MATFHSFTQIAFVILFLAFPYMRPFSTIQTCTSFPIFLLSQFPFLYSTTPLPSWLSTSFLLLFFHSWSAERGLVCPPPADSWRPLLVRPSPPPPLDPPLTPLACSRIQSFLTHCIHWTPARQKPSIRFTLRGCSRNFFTADAVFTSRQAEKLSTPCCC